MRTLQLINWAMLTALHCGQLPNANANKLLKKQHGFFLASASVDCNSTFGPSRSKGLCCKILMSQGARHEYLRNKRDADGSRGGPRRAVWMLVLDRDRDSEEADVGSLAKATELSK